MVRGQMTTGDGDSNRESETKWLPDSIRATRTAPLETSTGAHPERWIPGGVDASSGSDRPGSEPPRAAQNSAPVSPESRVPGVVVPLWMAAVLGLLLVASIGLGIAALVDGGGGTTRVVSTSAGAATPSSPVRPSQTPEPTPAGFDSAFADARPTDDPFELDGVRWAVFADPDQPWTEFTNTAKPGKGRQWLTVSVRVRNLGRPGLRAQQLPFMLVGESGTTFTPDPRFGSGPKVRAGASTVQVGKTDQVELAYKVPLDTERFILRFATRPFGGKPLAVALMAK